MIIPKNSTNIQRICASDGNIVFELFYSTAYLNTEKDSQEIIDEINNYSIYALGYYTFAKAFTSKVLKITRSIGALQLHKLNPATQKTPYMFFQPL